ncbi:hypothetical protein [Gordonia bronchialis]|uniref:hypothetical protein n=1 Tax=Gordonia bronchialis TaxID=2054 RepID=UPI0024305512|nr:hypothetical protein [Gordonia bronchialis]
MTATPGPRLMSLDDWRDLGEMADVHTELQESVGWWPRAHSPQSRGTYGLI